MLKIAVVPGDGIGPEVIAEGLKVLDALEDAGQLSTKRTEIDIGASRFLRSGELLPEKDLSTMRSQDAIYFGAIGDSRVPTGVLERGILLAMRSRLDQFVNVRPVRSWHDYSRLKDRPDFNITFLRENTEDFYLGAGGVLRGARSEASVRIERNLYRLGIDLRASSEPDGEYAFEIGLMSREGVARFAEFVMSFAKRAGEKRVTVVDKANVCVELYGLWREVFGEKAAHAGVELDFMFVDAMAMALVRSPGRFGVVATPNMFGDILTDLGAELQGSLGLSASGNVNPFGVSMFEPVHGSAPDIVGKRLANPFGAILAAGIMLDHLGRPDLKGLIEDCVLAVMKDGTVTPDLGGHAKTDEVGDAVVRRLEEGQRRVSS